jgi:hypothetical protein
LKSCELGNLSIFAEIHTFNGAMLVLLSSNSGYYMLARILQFLPFGNPEPLLHVPLVLSAIVDACCSRAFSKSSKDVASMFWTGFGPFCFGIEESINSMKLSSFLNSAIEMAILVRKSKRSKKGICEEKYKKKLIFKIMVNSKCAWRKLKLPTAQPKVECNRFACPCHPPTIPAAFHNSDGAASLEF